MPTSKMQANIWKDTGVSSGYHRQGRGVMEVVDANSECYLWSRNSLLLSYWLFSKGQTAPNFQRKPLERNFFRRNYYVNFPNEIKASDHPMMSCSIFLHPWRSSLGCNLRTVINQILVTVS